MAGVNLVVLLGRVGKDPETRTTNNGNTIATFSLATSERYKDRNGEQQEETQWHRCTAFGKLAEIVSQYVVKGQELHITGKIKYGKYAGQDGIEKYTTDIIVRDMQMLGKPQQQTAKPAAVQPAPQEAPDDFDDDLPF